MRVLCLALLLSSCSAAVEVKGFNTEDERARAAIIENDKSLKKAFAEIYQLKKALGLVK